MKNMKKTLKLALLFLFIIFIFFIINQLTQIIVMVERFSPLLAIGLSYAFAVAFCLALVTPLFLYFRLPRKPEPPLNNEGEEYLEYLKKLQRHLAKNQVLKDSGFCFQEAGKLEDQIEEALSVLDEKAEEIIKEAASTVFISTAVSQNGNLDGVFALYAQTRMVIKVAGLYYQRPAPVQLGKLFANVMVTALLVREMDDLEIITDQVEPIISAALGTTLGSMVPATNMVISVVLNSLLQGSANAFMTLRIGYIARRYCRSLVQMERRRIKKYATIEAASMLKRIVSNSMGVVTRGILKAVKRSTRKFAHDSKDKMTSTVGGAIRYAAEKATFRKQKDKTEK